MTRITQFKQLSATGTVQPSLQDHTYKHYRHNQPDQLVQLKERPIVNVKLNSRAKVWQQFW